MLKFRESVFVLIFILIFTAFAEQNTTKQQDNDSLSQQEIQTYKKRYEIAVDMFKKGSYYSAIDEVYPVLLNPKNPYYPYGLFLMSKIYLHIGKKTGKKDFLVKALYFINTYLYTAKDSTQHWDYYYTKGNIYENLFQYEKALRYYKISFVYAIDNDQQFKSIIGLLRTAAWTKKLDIATRYLILINADELSKTQKNEFYFVKGLLSFKQEKYKEAFSYLSKVYKEYEQLLIDNPYYYLIVAETAYRYGKLKFAQQLFRRIISVIKDPYIVRQALLRLGDIELKLNHPIYAFNYYYSIIEKFPKSQEADIAKLKILSAQYFYKDIKKKVLILKEKDEDFKKPFIFAYKVWISNRNNYLGDFALGNLGLMIFKLNYDSLFKKFLWELSLVASGSIKYEHSEYIDKLWRDSLLKLDNKKVCQMYTSNPNFFKKVFIKDKPVAEKILYDLWLCGKTKEELNLAKTISEKWKDKKSKLLLSKAYLDNKQYKKAISILNNIKDNSCLYYKIKVQASLLIGLTPDVNLLSMEKTCKEDTYAKVYEALAYYFKGDTKKAVKLLVSLKDKLGDVYKKDPFVKETLNEIIEKSIAENKYARVHSLLKTLTLSVKDDCFINANALIVSVRLKKEKEAESFYKKVKSCSSNLAEIAKNIYESYKIIKEAKK